MLIDGEALTEHVGFDVWFGSIEQETRWLYDIWVHIWMVLIGWDGKCGDDQLRPCQWYDENERYVLFDIARLKNHRDFYFGLSIEDGERTLHIYDKKTFWKVAQW